MAVVEEPSRRLGKEENQESKNTSRQDLQSERNPPLVVGGEIFIRAVHHPCYNCQ